MADYMDESHSVIPGIRLLKRDARHTTRSFYRYIFAINPDEFGMERDLLVGALDAEGMECWTDYKAMNNYALFQPQKSKLAIPNAFPEYFDFKNMKLPVDEHACEHEAVWLDENVFRAAACTCAAVSILCNRQGKAECAALSLAWRFRPDASTVGFDNSTGNRQPDPTSSPRPARA
jgi:hypothetical protein